MDDYKVQGVKINYYYVCKRKLWLFSKGITMEQNSDRVLQGKVLHEVSYPREKNKEVLIDNLIKIDIMDKEYVKEVKISSKMEQADKMQLYYYLYYLKKMGIHRKGKLNYVKEKRVDEIELSPEIEQEIENTIEQVKLIEQDKKPQKAEQLPYCKKCAYYEFCFIGED
ncbi:MAG: CRISPR-associated protein Cas4 [Epulopiscium sp. Nele67-Bin004]|nr:MAG: CRISPR-associated protein Cas4 [Epulopiscium sp. Nele67-Bin004]